MATAGTYPANTFALEYLVEACATSGLRSIVEVGVGHGTAVDVLVGAGLDVTGFDRDPVMVETSRRAMVDAGQDSARVSLGDMEDPSSYVQVREAAPFDALLGLGILPTALDEAMRAAREAHQQMLGRSSRNLGLQQGRGFIKTPPYRKASFMMYIHRSC